MAMTPVPPSNEQTFFILDIQPHFCLAASTDLFVIVFQNETRASDIAHMLTRADKMSRVNKKSVTLLNIVRPNAPVPNEAARKALVDAFRYVAEQGGNMQSAVVFEGSGAKASIIRSIVTGLSLMLPSILPIKVFSTVNEAAIWLEPRLTSITARDVTKVRAIVADMDARWAILDAKTKGARKPT